MPRNSESDVIKEAKERIEKLRNEMSELQTQLGFIVAISLLVVTPFLIEPDLRPSLEEEVFEIMRFLGVLAVVVLDIFLICTRKTLIDDTKEMISKEQERMVSENFNKKSKKIRSILNKSRI